MAKSITRIVLMVIVVALAVAAFITYQQRIADSEEDVRREFPPTVVESTLVKEDVWRKKIHVSGQLKAFQSVTLKSAVVQGVIVDKIYFESGQYVEQGTELFKLNPGNISIRAPFSGYLGLQEVDLGQYVAAGAPLITLQQLNPVKAEFNVPQTEMGDLKKQQEVAISSSAYPGKQFHGRIYAIDPQLDMDTRSARVWAEVPNDDLALYPGTFVDVWVLTDKQIPVIAVPKSALVYSDDAIYVYRIEDNKAMRVDVKLGMSNGDMVAVTDGLHPGEQIVSVGQQKLSPGAPVIIENEKPTARLQAEPHHAAETATTTAEK